MRKKKSVSGFQKKIFKVYNRTFTAGAFAVQRRSLVLYAQQYAGHCDEPVCFPE